MSNFIRMDGIIHSKEPNRVAGRGTQSPEAIIISEYYCTQTAVEIEIEIKIDTYINMSKYFM